MIVDVLWVLVLAPIAFHLWYDLVDRWQKNEFQRLVLGWRHTLDERDKVRKDSPIVKVILTPNQGRVDLLPADRENDKFLLLRLVEAVDGTAKMLQKEVRPNHVDVLHCFTARMGGKVTLWIPPEADK